MTDLARFFHDPLIRAAILERLSDDDLAALASTADPLEAPAAELADAQARLRRRLDPPEAVLDFIARHGQRLLGSSSAALQHLVASAEEVREALIGVLLSRRAVATYGGPAAELGDSPLELLTRTKGAPAIRGRTCQTALQWDAAGRVAGLIRVPEGQLDQLEPWRCGWALVTVQSLPPFAFDYRARVERGLEIALECPAPTRIDGKVVLLPSADVEVTLIADEG
jgi:hypothetical protein